MSDRTSDSDNLDYIREALTELNETMHSIESMLDQLVTVAESTLDATGETAWNTRGRLRRWRDSWAHAKFITELTRAEGENDLPVMPERWLK